MEESMIVGRIEAGLVVLITAENRLIEFPRALLPDHIFSGAIVRITVIRNKSLEIEHNKAFSVIQGNLLQRYGSITPKMPSLEVRNITQTSVVLGWDLLQIGSALIHSLVLYRNNVKAGVIPHTRDVRTTKVSGLAVDAEYTFNLKLRTSAGTFSSNDVRVRTHKITDLTGLRICIAGMPETSQNSIIEAAHRIGAKILADITVDTTHCISEKGSDHFTLKANQSNIPIVSPDWLFACERDGRVVGVKNYYPCQNIA